MIVCRTGRRFDSGECDIDELWKSIKTRAEVISESGELVSPALVTWSKRLNS